MRTFAGVLLLGFAPTRALWPAALLVALVVPVVAGRRVRARSFGFAGVVLLRLAITRVLSHVLLVALPRVLLLGFALIACSYISSWSRAPSGAGSACSSRAGGVRAVDV